MTSEQVEAFRASLKRCLADASFMKGFYDLFTSASDQVREKFQKTDFERPNRVLADSLYMMAAAALSGEESLVWREMRHIAS